MDKPCFKFIIILLTALLCFACNSQKQVEVDVNLRVNLDGDPAAGAQVSVDGVETGTTDNLGRFSTRLKRLPGQQVSLMVDTRADGYRIEPWRHAFVTKLVSNTTQQHDFDVDLENEKYVTVTVLAGDEPLAGVSIRIQDKFQGQTDANGEYTYTYSTAPRKGFKVKAGKKGYRTWKKTLRLKPGHKYDIALRKYAPKPKPKVAKTRPAPAQTVRAAVTPAPVQKTRPETRPKANVYHATVAIEALTEAYGVTRGIAGAVVVIDGRKVGKTKTDGRYTYVYKGRAGQKARIQLTVPGHIPAKWETAVSLKGRRTLRHYFYPANPKPIKVGMYGYVNNSPEKDLTGVMQAVETSVADNLFRHKSFARIDKPRLREMLLRHTLDMETLSTQGWQHTGLIKSVDLMVSGSVTKGDSGYTIESTVITAAGKILLSQINTARRSQDIPRTAKVIAGSIVDQFPFEGAIAAIDDDGYRINLGQHNYKIRRGNAFRYLTARTDAGGRIKGYREEGKLRIVKTGADASWADIVALNDGRQLKVGDKVVRQIYLDEEREAAKATVTIGANARNGANTTPLWGVNVYLNNSWVGTTRANGKVSVPVSLYDEHALLLSRHGFQPVTTTLSVDADRQHKAFVLDMANALFKIESEPSRADVYVDGVKIGQTPLVDGELVNFGFRKVRLSVGGDYRDWQKVIEFNKPELDFSGANKVVFLKDDYKIGQTAEQNSRIDAAIQAYSRIERNNPDYSDARHRLAQIYMDDKKDYDNAIGEFEKVLALPENQQIIYKQFAVTYTNLGHAYYEKGNKLVWSDKRAAAQSFAKAIAKLKIARQNTRFFPTAAYSEAVHDTYYYTAIAYHKLYLVTKKASLIAAANQAWREYFDFFPKQLEGQHSFESIRSAARKYWSQIKDMG